MIYSPETNAVLSLTLATLHLITLLQKAFLKMLTLCTLALLHHARPVLPSSSYSMLFTSLLGVDCLSSPLLGGPGPPSPPSPELTPFPSGPRQRPTFVSGTISSHKHDWDLWFFFIHTVAMGIPGRKRVWKYLTFLDLLNAGLTPVKCQEIFLLL